MAERRETRLREEGRGRDFDRSNDGPRGWDERFGMATCYTGRLWKLNKEQVMLG